jgi:hypothetical protein
MASFEGNAVVEFQRWTGKRKADAVLDIIKGKLTLIDFCRASDLKQSDVEKCTDEFIKGDINSLKVNPKDAAAQKQKEVDELPRVVREQALVIRVLKKSIEMAERDEIE